MKNQQAPEPRLNNIGEMLDVHSIFDTIQGEGPFAGMPATFIRLAGCNLQCPLCDTEYTEGRKVMWREQICQSVNFNLPLVVITGGEPFRQYIMGLVSMLNSMRRMVQIETNGKFDCGSIIPKLADIVVSPKTATINETTALSACAYKYVISHDGVAGDGLPINALGHTVPVGKTIARPPKEWRGPIYVQPADAKDDETNRANMAAAVRAVMMEPGQRKLCIQMHKYAELA